MERQTSKAFSRGFRVLDGRMLAGARASRFQASTTMGLSEQSELIHHHDRSIDRVTLGEGSFGVLTCIN